jgi:hypothetical protein
MRYRPFAALRRACVTSRQRLPYPARDSTSSTSRIPHPRVNSLPTTSPTPVAREASSARTMPASEHSSVIASAA